MPEFDAALAAKPSVLHRSAGFAGHALRSGLRVLADVMMPPTCLACREPLGTHDTLCPECWRRVDFISSPLCDRLGIPLPYSTGEVMISAAAAADPPDYDRARAVAHFDGVMRELIHGFKFADRHDARRLFLRWLGSAGAELIATADVIVPVPLGRLRLIRRKFNQAAILARGLAAERGIAFAPLALVRTRATRTQVGLTRAQRRDNVSGAFAVPAREALAIAGRNVLLIDDVITTGATAGACARALKRAGAARVDLLALGIVADSGGVGT